MDDTPKLPPCPECHAPLQHRYRHFYCVCGWEGHRFDKTKNCSKCKKRLYTSRQTVEKKKRLCFTFECPNQAERKCNNCEQMHCAPCMRDHNQCLKCHAPLIRWGVEHAKILKAIHFILTPAKKPTD